MDVHIDLLPNSFWRQRSLRQSIPLAKQPVYKQFLRMSRYIEGIIASMNRFWHIEQTKVRGWLMNSKYLANWRQQRQQRQPSRSLKNTSVETGKQITVLRWLVDICNFSQVSLGSTTISSSQPPTRTAIEPPRLARQFQT